MTTHVAVCPSIVPAHTKAMRATATAMTINVWDNTRRNAGVSHAWNWGVEQMRAHQADWLIIVSSSVRFGPSGGADLLAALDDGTDTIAVEGAPHLGWHLIAFRADVFDRVGLFDENFWPAYWEDLDFGRRVALGFGLDPPYWRKVEVDATVTGYGEAAAAAGVHVNSGALMAYTERKWAGIPGRDPEDVLHKTPFGRDVPLSWWPPKGHRLGSGQMP